MKHWIVLWLVIAGALIACAQLVERVFHVPVVETAQSLIAEPDWTAGLAVVGLLGIDLFLPIPSSLVMTLSGVIFGAIPGGVLSVLGSMAGNLVGFELARRQGAGAAKRLVGESALRRLNVVFQRHGAMAVILTRPIPVLMESMSVVAGLADMKRGKFVMTSALGTVPMCFVYSYAGSVSLQAQTLVPAIVAAVALPAAGWIVWRWRLRER